MLGTLKSMVRYPLAYLKFRGRGKNLWLGARGSFCRPEEIRFGSNIFINEGFHLSARNLTFGDHIMAGPNLVIECDDHVYNEVGVTMFENRNRRSIESVTVEDDVWLGANVTVLKGVTISEGSVVGAHSVVSRSLPPYSICVGAPCKAIKSRFTHEELVVHLQEVGSEYSAEQVKRAWDDANI